MKRIIHVCLGLQEASVGELRYDRQGRRENAAFAYSPEWLAGDERFAIDPSLPLVSGFQFRARHPQGSVFHGAIADTEPDGWGRRVILRAHAKRRQSERARGSAVESEVPGSSSTTWTTICTITGFCTRATGCGSWPPRLTSIPFPTATAN